MESRKFEEDKKFFDILEEAEDAIILCANLSEDIGLLLSSDPGAGQLDKTTRRLLEILTAATDTATGAMLACKEVYRAKLLETYDEDPGKWKKEREARLKDLGKFTEEKNDLQSLVAFIELQTEELKEYGAVITVNQIENQKNFKQGENDE